MEATHIISVVVMRMQRMQGMVGQFVLPVTKIL